VKVVRLDETGTKAAVAILRDAIRRCEDHGWTAVVILGYGNGNVEVAASDHKSTDTLVGALERAKWELFDKGGDK
jgi:hypothetical protein